MGKAAKATDDGVGTAQEGTGPQDSIFDADGNDRIATLEDRVSAIEDHMSANDGVQSDDTGLNHNDRLDDLEAKTANLPATGVAYITTETLSNALTQLRESFAKDLAEAKNVLRTASEDSRYSEIGRHQIGPSFVP